MMDEAYGGLTFDQGTVTTVTDMDGNPGVAYHFDGASTSFMDFRMAPLGQQAWTVEYWVAPSPHMVDSTGHAVTFDMRRKEQGIAPTIY